MDACRRGRSLRDDADACAPRAVPRGPPRPYQSGVRSVSWPPGRRACESQHALPHRRVPADERDLARCGHFRRPDSRPRDGRGHTACIARAVDRVRWRPPARATSGSRARIRTRSRGVDRPRRSRPSTTRARSSNGCSATAAAPTRRRGSRGSARTGACSTRSAKKSRACRDRSARATARSLSSTSSRFATWSAVSRRPRSRAARNCRSSNIPPASRRRTTSTSA